MLHKKTLAELSRLLTKKDCSSVELTRLFLDRIEKHNPELNAFITVSAEQALADAKRADHIRHNPSATEALSPLLGVPFAHKDIFCTKGIKTSCASKMLDNFIAPYDATVVQKTQSAGLVMLGKTNMDEFAMGSSNENSYYGAVKNPWDLSRVPGGSSGGSAAAVAARLIPATTGTDTGGSIRQPASFCGITGIKPTYGRISRYGMIAFASSLDQAGPMAQTAEDCAFLLHALAGLDAKDSTSANEPVPNYVAALQERPIKGLKIGLPAEFFTPDLDPAVQKIISAAIEQLKQMGATFQTVHLPNIGLSVPTYYIIAPAECSSNLSRFDGIRFGHRCENPVNLEDLYKRSRSEGFGKEVQRRILMGTYVLSAGFYDAYYVKAQQIRRLISEDFKKALQSVDVILGPTTPSIAFPMGEKSSDPVSMYLSDIYTIGVSLAGLPAITFPVGFANQMPVGVQLIGGLFQESRLLSAAHEYQQATDWHSQCPVAFE
jgi:aspartyl-tRNA(Asn)/glutamyl-tRNA(Gln) amidotransferase subunit A